MLVVVLFGLLMTIRTAFSFGVEIAGLDRLVLIHKVSLIMPLPVSYKARLQQVKGVELATHQSWFGGIYQDPSNFIANFAVEPESWLAMYPEYTLPDEQKKAWFANRTGAIVGIDTARRFGWKVGDRVPLQGTIYRTPNDAPWEFTIEGIYDSAVLGTDKTQFFFHYNYLNETLQQNFGRDQVGWYIVKVANPAEAFTLSNFDITWTTSSTLSGYKWGIERKARLLEQEKFSAAKANAAEKHG